ncbi:uncharacterized protein KY384_000045 [Bacidia gigantensis]|uniref:uncharacterized protein n=1 Tax=Bacidia gigantensis TaxID=2732470 RepID=UPI001D055269|nr:uncharacterized protein KY384_000045 [Bacidia gigantensis]KAG8526452.1 hypothetical protein KY384_000045 [Bacidia gigantensis]
MSVNRIVQLGSLIAIKASDIDSKLTAAGVATPSFKAQTSVSNFASLEEIAESRVAILEATDELHSLLLGPVGQLTSHSGFNLAHQTNQSAFQRLTSHVDSRARYEAAMQWFHADPGLRADHILCGYPWRSIPEQTVVDVGGSHGAIGIAIAEAYPTLRLIVQDQADVVQAGSARLPLDLKSRVSFMIHDFLESQPVGYAAVYILRWVLHDWSDAYATKILKALRPALKRGAAILICELIMPEPGTVSMYEARSMRSMDMAMLEFHNGKERDREDWVNLLQRADERFCIVNVRQPPGSRLSFIEVRWDVQSNGPGHQEDGTL